MSNQVMAVESFHSHAITGQTYTYVARYRIKGEQVLWIANVKKDVATWEIHGQIDAPEDTQRDAAAAVQASVNRQIDAI
jgi:hypothetical protein